MTVVGSAAALVVAVVLAVAAGAKAVRPARTAADLERLGLPAPRLLAGALPVGEAAVAAALVLRPGWGAIGAFALLAGFTAYLAGLVRSGRTVPCACFGSVSARPVSVRELVRNGALLVAAGLAATVEGPVSASPMALGLAAAALAGGAALGHLTPRPAPGPADRTRR